MLAPLGNFGGPTQTMALLADSPAIGAGSVALAVDASDNPLANDQRGPRLPADREGDRGHRAFEYQPASTVYVSSSYASDVSGTEVTWTDGSTHYVGYDAFGTIQAGVNAVATGGTVDIAAGIYAEQVTVSQSMALAGAGSATTFLEPPAGVNAGDELEIDSGASVSLSGITVDPVRSMTAIDVNGGSLIAASVTVISYNVGISVENAGAVTITGSTISATTGLVVGSGASDTSTVSATDDSFAGDTVGVQNNETGPITATMDWWGSSTGPNSTSNPGGTGASGWQRQLELLAGRLERQPGRLPRCPEHGWRYVRRGAQQRQFESRRQRRRHRRRVDCWRRHALLHRHRRDRHHRRRVRDGQHRRIHNR